MTLVELMSEISAVGGSQDDLLVIPVGNNDDPIHLTPVSLTVREREGQKELVLNCEEIPPTLTAIEEDPIDEEDGDD